jgi:hypothetical protein
MTISGPVLFTILAVAAIVMVIGSGPQANVMMPPRATALTTAADVQLAGVPFPITHVGVDVSTARASAGTAALPFGLPTGMQETAVTIARTMRATRNFTTSASAYGPAHLSKLYGT